MVSDDNRAGGRRAGKVAIVTGAGSRAAGVGTGKAAAILFAREGASVLLVDAAVERAEQTLADIEREGGKAAALQADVTAEADCKRIADTAARLFGRVDILFNNVGVGSPGTVLDVEEDAFDRVIATNVRSMVMTSKYAIPHMAAAGGGGRRRYHQHIVHSGHTGGQQRREHPLRGVQGRRYRADNADVGSSRAGQRTGELHRARPAVHADGRGQAV